MTSNQSVYGIIGYPVSHSLSPLMHNAAFQELGVNAIYKTFPLQENELEDFIKGLKDKHSPIFGLNVTVPYKEKVLKYLDSLNPFAEKVQAVNTIVISKDRSLQGINTDGPGFLAHLTEVGFNTHKKRIAILGAGGTARAIISVLCLLPEHPESITIYNHHPAKAKDLISDLGKRMEVGVVKAAETISDLHLERADLFINTTPVGLKIGDPCPIDEELFHSHTLVYDVIYNPPETLLLKAARRRGLETTNGLGMLFYQGVLAFQHWANIQLDEKIKTKMRQSLKVGAHA